MGKTFDALDYEYTMKEFVEILESGLYNGCSKEQYEDTLNTLMLNANLFTNNLFKLIKIN